MSGQSPYRSQTENVEGKQTTLCLSADYDIAENLSVSSFSHATLIQTKQKRFVTKDDLRNDSEFNKIMSQESHYHARKVNNEEWRKKIQLENQFRPNIFLSSFF
jgi:hypothetical protein